MNLFGMLELSGSALGAERQRAETLNRLHRTSEAEADVRRPEGVRRFRDITRL